VLVELAEHSTRAGVDLRMVAGTCPVRRLLALSRLDRDLALVRATRARCDPPRGAVVTGAGRDGTQRSGSPLGNLARPCCSAAGGLKAPRVRWVRRAAMG
jgi:hypothetical protein